MNLKIKEIITALCCIAPFVCSAQNADDALKLSSSELRGTARYMSMAGAYGALGGDASSVLVNPAGIGVYRSSDASVTLDLNLQSSSSSGAGNYNNTVFSCNNASYIGAYNLNSEALPYFNWGFSYNRAASFNSRSRGRINNLQSSLSNFVAGFSNDYNLTTKELGTVKGYDPYQDSYSPWLSILAYDSYMINATNYNESGVGKDFQGLYGDGTSGNGYFENEVSGGVDQYNFNFGGNIYNKVYWGMGFGITDLNRKETTYYEESLSNAYVYNNKNSTIERGDAGYGLTNYLHTTGTGFNFNMGFILKPINELRLGFSFSTPTYYSLKDEYYASTWFKYPTFNGDANTNGGYYGETWYKLSTPWKFNASAAIVASKQAILSFDYEYNGTQTMKVSDDGGSEYVYVSDNISNYYKQTNTYRVGFEYRVTPKFSLRCGYSYQDSPVKSEVLDNSTYYDTSGTMCSYLLPKSTQYITGGFGYKMGAAYIDMAYVNKRRISDYHAFSPVPYSGGVEPSPTARVTNTNNQVVLTLGVRF